LTISTVLESLPHDTSAFTQGLSFCNGHLYQGTGLHGSSSIQKLDPDNPSVVLQSYDLSSKYFGEGITYYTNGNGQGRFLQLTWKERTAIVYNVSNIMKPLFRFRYHAVTSNGEGWGITFDALRHEFIVSDGSDQLFFWDASFLDNCERNLLLAENKSDTICDDEITLCDILTMEPKRSIKVRVILDGDSSNTGPIPVRYLNELELIWDDETGTSSVLANVWFQNCIIEIDPNTGNVVKLYDLSSLCPERHPRGENVLNGISVSDEGGRIVYVTGKQWPYLYKIKLL
jgi:glutamine cyclotransferase